jgi:hypothetical protein
MILQPGAAPLQGAEVVGVAELSRQLGVDGPVAVARCRAEILLQARGEIGGEPVVVEQRVVDVEQEHHVVPGGGLGCGHHHGDTTRVGGADSSSGFVPQPYSRREAKEYWLRFTTPSDA